jgi:hypothetical protein
MQKILEIKVFGQEACFKTTKIIRSKIYGQKRRIPIDAHGHECQSASLTCDGKFILPQGGTSLLYLDGEGDVVERELLQTIDQAEDSTPDTGLEIGQTTSPLELLDYSITHTYHLEPVFLAADIESELSQGKMFTVTQAHSSDTNHRMFLLKGDNGYFLLIGNPTGFDYIGLYEADLSPPNDDEYSSDYADEIDFRML